MTRHDVITLWANRPKSICSCGHTGDGPNGAHTGGLLNPGHGACTVPGCPCEGFTWTAFQTAFADALESAE